MQDKTLLARIEKNRERIPKLKDQNINEQTTKVALINPVLRALGWDIEHPDEVELEYKRFPKDLPVDYALKLSREPKLFVEAKALGQALLDHKAVTQVVNYTTNAGVKWCLLTDGDEFRIYNAGATEVPVEQKLFYQVAISKDPPEKVAEMLSLVSRENLEKSSLEALWNAHFVDRQVTEALGQLFASADRRLVLLVRKQVPSLKPKEITDSLLRLRVRIDFPDVTPSSAPTADPITCPDCGRPCKSPLALAIHKGFAHREGKVAKAAPNRPDKDEKGKTGEGRREFRRAFWMELLAKARAKTDLHNGVQAGDAGWVSAGGGMAGLAFSYVIRKHDTQVELWISCGNKSRNKTFFDYLAKSRKDIEDAFGGSLEWQRLDDKDGCRIAKLLDVGGYRDKAKWPEIHVGMVDAMVRLERALKPRFAGIKL